LTKLSSPALALICVEPNSGWGGRRSPSTRQASTSEPHRPISVDVRKSVLPHHLEPWVQLALMVDGANIRPNGTQDLLKQHSVHVRPQWHNPRCYVFRDDVSCAASAGCGPRSNWDPSFYLTPRLSTSFKCSRILLFEIRRDDGGYLQVS
jgi:hypothetical protein